MRDTGFTHVEFLPVAEHPFGGSWGYQVSSYYAPSARFGTPDDFRYLVDALHQAGIGVIVDWVPAHFPKDEWALGRFDGTPLYEHADPRRGEQPDWGTFVFDFGRSEVRNFLVANALYWLEEFHIDGLRVDAVASMLYLDYSRKDGEWVPNKLRRPREPRGGRVPAGDERDRLQAGARRRDDRRGVDVVAGRHPRRPTSAASASASSGTWAGCTTRSTTSSHEPIHRQYHHHEMTFSMMYAYTENFVLPLSHDEVVHGKGSLLNKMPGDRWQQMATLRALFAFMWAHPGKQLLFMGQEFAQGARVGRGALAGLVAARRPRPPRRAPAGPRPEPRLPRDAGAVVARHRPGRLPLDRRERRRGQRLLVPALRRRTARCSRASPTSPPSRTRATASACPAPGAGTRSSTPTPSVYFGSGVGNFGGVEAADEPWHGQPASATLRVPPLGALWLRYAG